MYVDRTATGFVCHPANTKNPQIILEQNILEEILKEISTANKKELLTKDKADVDFHGLWRPAIEKVIPDLSLFRYEDRDKEYRSAISRYYSLRKAVRNVQTTKAKDFTVLPGDAGSMKAKVFINAAVSLTFSTTIRWGKIRKDQLKEGPKVLRANLGDTRLNPYIYEEARKKAVAAMNKFRKTLRK